MGSCCLCQAQYRNDENKTGKDFYSSQHESSYVSKKQKKKGGKE